MKQRDGKRNKETEQLRFGIGIFGQKFENSGRNQIMRKETKQFHFDIGIFEKKMNNVVATLKRENKKTILLWYCYFGEKSNNPD